eukprot:TRINITY_DN2967_c0_g1_i1.p1 TRINITY_DN2967_c0_g1~~TRINITY_DN2967_c0_g1_i1.p1  ORF type:complete len:263 (+),score=89.15 TRINITY_DN2967_c0_g1_i1:76-864(+)
MSTVVKTAAPSATTEVTETAAPKKAEHVISRTEGEYLQLAEKMLERFLTELKNTDNAWEPVFSTDKIQAWKKINEETGVYQVKFIAMVPYSQAVVEKNLFDLSIRKSWDSMISEIIPIEKYSNGDELIHFQAPGLMGVGARDLVHYRIRRELPEDNANIVLDVSVVNDRIPEDPNYVRAHTVLSAGKFQPTKFLDKNTKKLEDACLYSMISELDAKGLVPKAMINFFGPAQTQNWFENLCAACERDVRPPAEATGGFFSRFF